MNSNSDAKIQIVITIPFIQKGVPAGIVKNFTTALQPITMHFQAEVISENLLFGAPSGISDTACGNGGDELQS
jgi:hypothetical protein